MLVPKPGFAQVPTRLVYVRSQGASDCPNQPALEAAVAARLGYEPFSPWGNQTIIATISPSQGGLTARAELVDRDGVAQGSRQVQVPRSDCKELIATLALAISITLDPTHAAAPPSASATGDTRAGDGQGSDPQADAPRASRDEPGDDSTAEVPAHDRDPRAPRAAPADETHAGRTIAPGKAAVSLHAHAGAFAAFALVPKATLGIRVGAGLRRGPVSLWLNGEATLPRAEAASQSSEVRISVLSGELALCGELVRPFSLCTLTLLGTMRGEGVGVSVPKKESRFYASVGARGLLFLPLGSVFSLVGTADLSGVLTQPTFQLDDVDVWQPSALAFGAGLGIAGRFL